MIIIVDVRIRFTCIRSRGPGWSWWTSVKPRRGPIYMGKVIQICFWQRSRYVTVEDKSAMSEDVYETFLRTNSLVFYLIIKSSVLVWLIQRIHCLFSSYWAKRKRKETVVVTNQSSWTRIDNHSFHSEPEIQTIYTSQPIEWLLISACSSFLISVLTSIFFKAVMSNWCEKLTNSTISLAWSNHII